MDEIRRQVGRARRRMVMGQFLGVLVWSLSAALLLALLALVAGKIWVLGVSGRVWAWSWIGGSLAGGWLGALVWTWLIRHKPLQAAMEIDRRFGLKERVSSSLSLEPDALDTEAGRALIGDTLGKLREIDVAERFPLPLDWRTLVPLLPVLALVGVLLIPNAVPDGRAAANPPAEEARRQIRQVSKRLKRRIQQRRKQAEQAGLKEAELVFERVQARLEGLDRSGPSDRKRALVRLNDLKKTIEDRRRQLGDLSQMRRHLEQLKNIAPGPADQAIRAIQQGNFDRALHEIKRLSKLITSGQLSGEQRKRLAAQLDQMARKLSALAQAHDQAKRDLQQQIKRAEQAGDLAKAGRLQQKLDQLRQQDRQMDRFRQMADKLGQCAGLLQPAGGREPTKGQLAGAADALDEIASQLQEMQQEMNELETLDEAMEEIAQAKDAMNCERCGGVGCEACGGGMLEPEQLGPIGGLGLNAGTGWGDRPEQKTETGHYWSKVRAEPKRGEAVRVGDAGGPNLAGLTKEQVKQQIAGSLRQQPDPLINQRLPRAQREHAKQYFDRLRTGR